MRMLPIRPVLVLSASALFAASVSVISAQEAAKAKPIVVHLKTSKGEDAGTARFTESKDGKELTIRLALKNIPAGEHAVHIHQNPTCDAPDFKGAGAHFNPDGKQHGMDNPMGHHNGDLPKNISIAESHTGDLTVKVDY